MNKIQKSAFVNALGTALYIAAVGLFMYYGSLIRIGRTRQILVPIALLMLFVCSAAITGYLLFGKPALLYIDGKKKEAVSLLFHTLGIFSVMTVFMLLVLVLLTQ
ncbi:hypothetical protein M1555_01045 [Patescibacteria group bacterium]|nr:hypothetical protein [Patescibacteria group bacterium]